MRQFITLLIAVVFTCGSAIAQNVLSPNDLLGLKYVTGAKLSPDAKKVIYTILTPRTANEKPGSSHSQYFVHDLASGDATPLFEEGFKAYSVNWTPNGDISFLHRPEGGKTQVFKKALGSADMMQVTHSANSISQYAWNPMGGGLAVVIKEGMTEHETDLKKRGYGFIFFEENLKNNQLFYVKLNDEDVAVETKQLTKDGHVWSMVFNAQGTQIAAGISPENLVDHKYMFQKVFTVNIESGEMKQVSKNEGKLGNFVFSPNGKMLAYNATLNLNDHSVSQAYVTDLATGEVTNYTPENYQGHVTHVDWKNDKELVYMAAEGVNNMLYSVALKGSKRKLLLDGKEAGIVFQAPVFDKKFKTFIFSGSTTTDRINLYSWKGKGELKQITNINPVLAEKELAQQSVINFDARDGLNIEGLLMLPVGYEEGKKYPLIVYVHGGPESHHTNSWLSSYSTPGQVMAGKGYMVAYFNYRASTGYGVEFGMKGLGDPAGKEFDDIADGIDYLVENYGADANRVGLAGGSYGGYASAWFATYYTEKVKAVAMFVGISNLISKARNHRHSLRRNVCAQWQIVGRTMGDEPETQPGLLCASKQNRHIDLWWSRRHARTPQPEHGIVPQNEGEQPPRSALGTVPRRGPWQPQASRSDRCALSPNDVVRLVCARPEAVGRRNATTGHQRALRIRIMRTGAFGRLFYFQYVRKAESAEHETKRRHCRKLVASVHRARIE